MKSDDKRIVPGTDLTMTEYSKLSAGDRMAIYVKREEVAKATVKRAAVRDAKRIIKATPNPWTRQRLEWEADPDPNPQRQKARFAMLTKKEAEWEKGEASKRRQHRIATDPETKRAIIFGTLGLKYALPEEKADWEMGLALAREGDIKLSWEKLHTLGEAQAVREEAEAAEIRNAHTAAGVTAAEATERATIHREISDHLKTAGEENEREVIE